MKRWKGLVIGMLVGAATAGIAVGVWRWGNLKTRTTEQWLADLRKDGAVADRLATMGDAGLEILLTARESQDIAVHRRAARGLSRMGEPAAKRLAPLLPRARGRVEVPLVAIGAAAVPAVEELLANDESAGPAARVLGMLGERAAAARSSLIGLLQDPTRDASARAAAALALGQIGDDDAARIALASAARNAPVKVRLEAIRALGLLGQAARPAVPALLAVLDDKDADLRAEAARVLGGLGAAAAAPRLAHLAAMEDEAAAEALARMGKPARAAFKDLLRAIEPWQAGLAVRALGPLLLPDLIEALADKETRHAACSAIAMLGPAGTPARPAMEPLLDEPARRDVLHAAVALLAVLPASHEKAALALGRLLERDPEADRTTAALGLAALAAPPAVSPALMQAALDRLDMVPVEAALALAMAEAPSLPPALLPALRARAALDGIGVGCLTALPDVGVRAREALPEILAALERPRLRLHAAAALARVAPEQIAKALPAFREALAREDGLATLASRLERMERPPAALLDAIRERLSHPSSMLLAALRAYPREDLLDLAPELSPMLNHPDRPVRLAAAALVRWIGRPAAPFVKPLLAGKAPSEELAAVARDPLFGLVPDPTEKEIQQARELLDDVEPERRAVGASALANAPEKQRAPHAAALAECLFDPAPRVREAAARALAGLPDGSSALREAMRDGDLFVRTAAAESLLASPEDRGAAGKRLVGDAALLPPALRLRLAEKVGPDTALTPLLQADARSIRDGSALGAAAWLARHGEDPTSVARLAAELTDGGHAEVAARLLGELGGKAEAARPWLERRLNRGSQAQRDAVRQALAKIR